ncbi:MAG: glycosyltransferase family 2 protein [Pseudomonadales bacterium]
MAKPAISILTPSKGMEHHLPGLIKNIDTQIGPHDEVILYFDGERPTNKFLSFLVGYPYVRYIIGETNIGPAAGRNLLAREARNPILRFQDADDQLAPYSLDQARTLINQLDEWHILVGGQLMYRNRVLSRIGIRKESDKKAMIDALARQNTMVVNVCYFNAESFNTVGGFDENIRFEEDWDLWLRYLNKFGDEAFTLTDRLFGIYNTYGEDDKHKLHIRADVRKSNREYIAEKHQIKTET